MKRKKQEIIILLWIFFFLGLILGMSGWVFFPEKVWIIIDFYMLIYSFVAFLAANYKFRINQRLKTFEGKIFGILTIITLFYFISQVVFVGIKFFYNIILKQEIYNVIINNDAIRFLTVTPRLLSYIFGIILIVILIKSYKLRTSWGRQFVWMLFSIVTIISTEYYAIHPLISAHENIGTGWFSLIFGSLIFPILSVTYIIMASTIFLFFSEIHKLKIFQYSMGALGLKAISDLVYLNLIYTNRTNTLLALLLDYNSVLFQILIIIAFLRYSFRYLPEPDFKKILLNRKMQNILKYIRYNPNCIKTDLTKKFEITRKTTDSYLKKLKRNSLINIVKEGREVLITISEKGIIYLNTLE